MSKRWSALLLILALPALLPAGFYLGSVSQARQAAMDLGDKVKAERAAEAVTPQATPVPDGLDCGSYLGADAAGTVIEQPGPVACDPSRGHFAFANQNDASVSLLDANLHLIKILTLPGGIGFNAQGVCFDASGNLYVVDTGNSTVQVFDANGSYLRGIGSLNGPQGIAVDTQGNVYVSCTGSNTVEELSSAGVAVRSFMATGSGFASFSGPRAVAVDGSGNVYVADTGNQVLSKFGNSGNFLLSVGLGQLNGPNGVLLDGQGHIVVLDEGNQRVVVFDSAGNSLSAFGSNGTGHGQFKTPRGLARDAGGNLYVSDDFGTHYSLQKFDSAGNFLAIAANGGGDLQNPAGMGADADGNIYVADQTDNTVHKYNKFGALLGTIGSSLLSTPFSVAVDQRASSGVIYVADPGNQRVAVFDKNGAYLRSVVPAAGFFNHVTDVKVDAQGDLYAVDSVTTFVEKFDSSGNSLVSYNGNTGGGPGQFTGPLAIAVESATGSVYVADSGGNRIQLFDSSGHFVTSFGSLGTGAGQFDSPDGLATDASGNLYVTEQNNTRVQKFNSSHIFVSETGSGGIGPGKFRQTFGVATDPGGHIYVSDPTNVRVEKLCR
jgi:tripartite motif-containing protein 71